MYSALTYLYLEEVFEGAFVLWTTEDPKLTFFNGRTNSLIKFKIVFQHIRNESNFRFYMPAKFNL